MLIGIRLRVTMIIVAALNDDHGEWMEDKVKDDKDI
jgi:hypothetical protein